MVIFGRKITKIAQRLRALPFISLMQFNHAFVQLISMPRFKIMIFYYNMPKTKFFLQKNIKFLSATGSTRNSPPPIANF